MKKKILIASIVALPFIALFLMWAVNKHVNEKRLDEDRAALFDECMYASYYFLEDVQNAISILNSYALFQSKLAYEQDEQEYGEVFNELYYNGFKENKVALSAYSYLKGNTGFLASAVMGYLEKGGELRQKESRAVEDIIYYWMTVEPNLEEKYEDYSNYLTEAENRLSESKQTLMKYREGASIDKYAWMQIVPSEKNMIWERYNEKKNWPFNIMK